MVIAIAPFPPIPLRSKTIEVLAQFILEVTGGGSDRHGEGWNHGTGDRRGKDRIPYILEARTGLDDRVAQRLEPLGISVIYLSVIYHC